VVVCLSGGMCRLFAYGPADATAVPKPRHLLPDLSPDRFLPFWYRLIQVVLEKRPLNGCSSSSSSVAASLSWVLPDISDAPSVLLLWQML